jgi:hypothetical protein
VDGLALAAGLGPAISAAMGFAPTSGLAAAFAALALFAAWRGARPPNPMRGPRLAPWRLIMLIAATAALLMVVHLVNLAGMTTGR